MAMHWAAQIGQLAPQLMLEVHGGPRQAGTWKKEKPQHCMLACNDAEGLNFSSCAALAVLHQSSSHLSVLKFSPRETKLFSSLIFHINPLLLAVDDR